MACSNEVQQQMLKIHKQLEAFNEQQAIQREELARSNAKEQKLLTRMKALFMELVSLAREEEEELLQWDVVVENHPAMDAFQVLDESPKPNTYIKSNEGAGEGQANKEEISKYAQMENENPQTHMLADTEDEDAGEMSNYSVAQECLDRLAISLGGTTIIPVSSELLPAYLAALEWQKHHAALICLAQIAEGCSKAHAASTVLNFIGNGTPEILTPYLDGIVSKLLVLLQNGKQMVQEGVTEMKVAVEILAAFKLAVVRLMFDPGGELSAIAAEFLKLGVKLLEGEAMIQK